jgi:hypothetical protein
MYSSHLDIVRLLAAKRRARLDDVALIGAMRFQDVPSAAR